MAAAETEKKYGIWLGLLLLVVIAFIFFLTRWSRRVGFSADDPVVAVPTDAWMLIETRDLPALVNDLTRRSLVWDDLCKIPDIKHSSRELHVLDSLFAVYGKLNGLFRGNKLILSLHNFGKSSVAILGVLSVPGRLRVSDLHDMAGQLQKGTVPVIRNYNHIKIFKVRFLPGHSGYFFALHKGLLLFSSSRILLEKGLRQMGTQESIDRDPSFRKVRNTAGKNETANIYLRADHMPGILVHWLSNAMVHKTEKAYPLGGWSELDLTIKEKSLLFNGFTNIHDTTGYLLEVPGENEPAPIDIMEVIPASCVSATVLSFGDLDKYQKRLTAYRQGKRDTKWAEVGRSFEKVSGKDPGNFFSSFVTTQVARVDMNIKNETDANNTFVIARVKSQSKARQIMEAMIKKYADGKSRSLKQYTSTVTFDPETRFTIYRLPFEHLPAIVFGRFTGDYPYTYVTFLDNYMLMGNSVKSAFSFLRFNILQQTLSHDPDFREFTEGMSMRSNLFYFLKLPESVSLVSRYGSEKVKKAFERYHQKNIKIKYIGYEAIAQNDMVYNNIYIRFKEKTEKKAVTVWESLLDTVIRYKPQIVINHRNHHKEIFIQDTRNRIYLINASGRILWKVPLREKIMGQAYQIDYYRNNKLQYLFNTRHYLYLIDRNGNFVERFPVALRSPATNSMSLFDYDKNKNYRIFIAGEDKKLYAYDKQGNLIPGWNIPKCESIVTGPVHHFVTGGKDYIVFSDTMNLYILDRRGNKRVRVPGDIPKPPRQDIFMGRDPVSHSSSIVLNSTGGKIYFVSLAAGKMRNVRFSDIPDDAWFHYEDLNGDGREEYIFLFGDRLQVMRSPDKKLFTWEMNNGEASYPPVIYTFSIKDKKIGIVDATHDYIYLVNNNGKLYNGFPLKGQTPFTIGRLGPEGKNFNLIVGGMDNFLYNYSVK